jgi:hypothetical protein
MTNAAKLQLVSKPKPSIDERSMARIDDLRAQLMAAVVHFVRKGKVGKPVERLNTASDRAGIPRGLIELEMRK